MQGHTHIDSAAEKARYCGAQRSRCWHLMVSGVYPCIKLHPAGQFHTMHLVFVVVLLLSQSHLMQVTNQHGD